MTFGQPQPIGGQLFSQIEGLLHRAEEPSEFELRSLMKRADELANARPLDASMAKAAVYAYRWDKDHTAYWVKNALNLGGAGSTLINAAVSFRLMNDVNSSAEHSRFAAQSEPHNSLVVSRAADGIALSGRYSEAVEILQACNIKDGLILETLGRYQKAVGDLALAGVSENSVVEQVSIAARLAASKRKRIVAFSRSGYFDPDDGHCFSVILKFHGSIQEEMALESELAAEFANLQDWNPIKLSVEFAHKAHNELQPH